MSSRVQPGTHTVLAVTTDDPEGRDGWRLIGIGSEHDSVLYFAKQAIGPDRDDVAHAMHVNIRLCTRFEAEQLGVFK